MHTCVLHVQPVLLSVACHLFDLYKTTIKHIDHMQGVTLPSKMWAHHHRFVILFFTTTILIIPSFFFIISSSSSVDHRVGGIINDDGSSGGIVAAAATNKLVDSICKQTSNYTFCVESIYRDPRAPKAHDYFLLAYISFGLAYLNATDTLSYIKHEQLQLEVEESDDYGSISSTSSLQRCREDYEKAVSALEEAYNDLNSETYFDLKVLANSASQDALHCSSSQQQQQQQLDNSNFKAEAVVLGSSGKLRRSGGGHSSYSVVGVLRKRNADLRGLCEICVLVSNQIQ